MSLLHFSVCFYNSPVSFVVAAGLLPFQSQFFGRIHGATNPTIKLEKQRVADTDAGVHE